MATKTLNGQAFSYDASKPSMLITGSSGGIGRATVIEFAKAGYNVFATAANEKERDTLNGIDSSVCPLVTDVTNQESIDQTLAAVSEYIANKGLNVLVNNAGIAQICPFEYIPVSTYELTMNINVTSIIRMSKTFLELLKKAKGTIINLGSTGGSIVVPLWLPYHASKFAVHGITEAQRKELAVYGIKVARMEPGNIKTPIWSNLAEASKQLLAKIPPEGHGTYKELIDETIAINAGLEESADPPEVVGKAILKVAKSKNPKLRNIVGKSAPFELFMRKHLSEGMWDWAVSVGKGKYLKKGKAKLAKLEKSQYE